MWNFLLNLQRVCDSRKTDDKFFFSFARKSTAIKKSLCGCRRCWHGKILAMPINNNLLIFAITMLFRADSKTSLTFLSRKKKGQFQHRTFPCPIYTSNPYNLPFEFYEKLVEENVRLWECEREDVVRDCKRKKHWAVHKEISSVCMCHIKMNKKR
jgi:hypothetical protein